MFNLLETLWHFIRLIKSRIQCYLSNETHIPALLLGICSFLFAFGLHYSTNTSPAYYTFLNNIGLLGWEVIFIVLGCFNTASGVLRIPLIIKLPFQLVGLWAWSFLCISLVFLHLDIMLPAQPLLLLPVILSVADLTIALAVHNESAVKCKEV